jgi:hypothetical protein
MLIKDYLQPYKTCSDYELSKKTGISATQIANIFLHGSMPGVENFVKICIALEIPSEVIQKWYEESKINSFQIANNKLNEILK